jgi:hypothetical protein
MMTASFTLPTYIQPANLSIETIPEMSQLLTNKQILEPEPVLMIWASTSANPNFALQLERNYLYSMGSTGTFYARCHSPLPS